MNKTMAGVALAGALILTVSCGPETTPSSPAQASATTMIGFIGAGKEDSDYSIYVMNTDNLTVTRLAPTLTAPPSASIWSPDRTTLAYLDRDFKAHKYWFSLVDVDGSNQRKVTDQPEFLPISWSWSADGKNIIMWCPTGGQAEPKPGGGIDERHYFDLFSLDINTGKMTRLTDTRNTGESSALDSPDGTKIAFAGSEHDPETWEIVSQGIYVMNPNGSDQKKVLDIPKPIRSFQWSPDSRKITYSSYDEKKGLNTTDIFVLDVLTGANTNLTNSPDVGDMDPAWSPDGKKIAFCSGVTRQGYHLRVMNADGTNVVDLHDLSDYPQGFPSWSTDGKRILFTDRQSIYSINADGTNLKTLLQGADTYRDILCPVWLSSPPTPGEPTPALSMDDQASIYAAAVRQLATVDDTFGGNLKPPRLFILRYAGEPWSSAFPTAIPQSVQDRVVEMLQDLPSTIVWIDKHEDAEFEEGEGMPVRSVKDGAIITLGNTRLQNDGSVQMVGSIYIGALASGGTTYVLQKKDGVWEITGITGPIWRS